MISFHFSAFCGDGLLEPSVRKTEFLSKGFFPASSFSKLRVSEDTWNGSLLSRHKKNGARRLRVHFFIQAENSLFYKDGMYGLEHQKVLELKIIEHIDRTKAIMVTSRPYKHRTLHRVPQRRPKVH